jgi:hypothetical protein
MSGASWNWYHEAFLLARCTVQRISALLAVSSVTAWPICSSSTGWDMATVFEVESEEDESRERYVGSMIGAAWQTRLMETLAENSFCGACDDRQGHGSFFRQLSR